MAIANRRRKKSNSSPLIIVWAGLWLIFSEAARGRCRPLIYALCWVWLVWALVPAAVYSLRVGYDSLHEDLAVEHVLHEDASVSRIGRVLLAANGKDTKSVQFRVEEADMIAQYMWPRTIVVNHGILERYPEDIVAMILAHEIGHWQASTEPLRKMVHAFLYTLTKRTIQLIPNDPAKQWSEERMREARIIILAAWSRQLESAADEAGFRIYTTAGYAPEAAIAFFEDRLEAQIKYQENPNKWTAQHPPRLERLLRAREQVRQFYETGQDSAVTYWRRSR